MPNRFYVPGCKSGFPDYPKDLGKFTMFSAPKDEKLLKRWNEFIPRKGALKPSSKDPWALFDPKKCERFLRHGTGLTPKMNPRYVALRVQFQLIAGKAVTSKSMRFNNGSAFLCVDGAVIGSSILHPFDEEESLTQQFSRIILDFDSSEICPGRALGRLLSKEQTSSSARKFQKLKFDYRMAKQKLDHKEHQLTVGLKRGITVIFSILTHYSAGPLIRPPTHTTNPVIRPPFCLHHFLARTAPVQTFMPLNIAAMEHQEHINKLEKMQMAAELWMKEAVIVAQTFDMLQLREEFMMQVKKAKENEDKFKNMLDGLSPKKLRFEGFADYGLDDINEDPKAATDQLADHCLVFIFLPYRSSWVQPIAVFATKGLAPGHIISRLLLKAIVALETIGARVNSVTCDGAQTNKTAWADCGISGTRDENGEISCSMKHPTAKEPGVRIWFLQDVPHLYKCIRSFIYSRRTLVKAKRKITKKQKATDAVVTESQVQLKRNTPENQKKPMLSLRNHIRLNYLVHSPLRNSSVKKIQVFKCYRTKNNNTVHKFRNTAAIEDLVLLLNNTFDALNGRQFKYRIFSGNWQQHKRVLLQLLQALDDSEAHWKASKDNEKPFLSDISLKAMRVTLNSAIQLVEFLLDKCNYSLVLSGKFNQDCIEVDSSVLYDHVGGGQDAPTATSFLRICRMLSMYVPVRNALRVHGNIDDEERTHILTRYKDCMLQSLRDNAKEVAAVRNSLKDSLLKGIISSTENEKNDSAGNELDLVQANSTYYLCDYLVHTRAVQISSESCIESLLTMENELPSDFYAAFLTRMKTMGFLRFASLQMYYAF
ncbi:Uncharacterized protein APZ42_031632 [Daphnia magna]|uniref:Transposable element P transposase-like RNase H domain-containing protein n=1 Tax=Daphnia magna TaxID=35525 RepID=A0A162DB25_9CRUS|nr:Uncharacterized protein APZ42_031632 [Daphnia magna]